MVAAAQRLFLEVKITLKQHIEETKDGGGEGEGEGETTTSAAAAPLRTHFADLTSRYGRVTVVDLLKATRGDEAMLRSAFSRAVSQLPEYKKADDGSGGGGGSRDVRYVAYDFHSESQGGNVAALTKLLMRLRTEVQEHGQYVEQRAAASGDAAADAAAAAAGVKTTAPKKTTTLSTPKPSSSSPPSSSPARKLQKGVFRVNCKDCLDRTNLVQSAVARTALEEQLRSLSLLGRSEYLGADLDRAHRNLWADHGDFISAQVRVTGFTGNVERGGAGDARSGGGGCLESSSSVIHATTKTTIVCTSTPSPHARPAQKGIILTKDYDDEVSRASRPRVLLSCRPLRTV